MYIWQFEYSSYSNPELPLLAYEVKNSWDEKSVRWGNQPAVDGAILDEYSNCQIYMVAP